MLLTIEDVTARQQAEATLRQQRDLLAVTLGSIGDAVLTTDPHGRITFLNPVAEALTGWPLQDALGQPCEAVFRLVHARTRQPLESPVAQVLRDGLVVGLAPETVLRTRDGRDLPIADLSAPIRSGGERAAGRRRGLSRHLGVRALGSAAAAGAEDGGARDLGRGDCPRLQQYSGGDPRLYRIGAGRDRR